MQKFGSKRGFKPKKGEAKLSKNDFSNVFFVASVHLVRICFNG